MEIKNEMDGVGCCLQAIRLRAEDTLVLSSPNPLSKDGRDRICANIRDHLGHSGKVLVLDCGLTVQAVLQRDDDGT